MEEFISPSSLLKKKRRAQEIHPCKRQFQWNQLNPEHLLDPSESRLDERAIFRLHWGVELEEDDGSHTEEMMQHVKYLHSKATRYDQGTAAAAVVILVKHFHLPLSEHHSLTLCPFHLKQ
jgi:hypothetical protein